jgi:hypothetical protein
LHLIPDQPDWRWTLVTELAGYSDTQAIVRLQTEDALCKRAWQFKRALDGGNPNYFPDMLGAHKLYLQEPCQKTMLEAYILAGADDAHISLKTRILPTVASAYHDLFFDIRSGLQAHAWICACVFKNLPYRSLNPHDLPGLLQRFAWLGGKDMLDDLVKDGITIGTVKDKFRKLLSDCLLKQSVETSMTIGSRTEGVIDALRLVVEGKLDDSTDSQDDEVTVALSTFLEDMAISVASPAVGSNLKLPAKEVREIDYEGAVK